jgi:hypothetical protein
VTVLTCYLDGDGIEHDTRAGGAVLRHATFRALQPPSSPISATPQSRLRRSLFGSTAAFSRTRAQPLKPQRQLGEECGIRSLVQAVELGRIGV